MNKRILFIIAGVLVVIVLAGGAFMAMRLVNAKDPASSILGGLRLFDGGGGKQTVTMKMIPAPELPKQTADVRGLVTSVEDGNLYVAPLNNIQVAVVNGNLQLPPTPAGPYTEVVSSKDTKIYRDITMESVARPSGGSGDVEIQQKLELSDKTIFSANSYVQVWGQRRGDRVIADVILINTLGAVKSPRGK